MHDIYNAWADCLEAAHVVSEHIRSITAKLSYEERSALCDGLDTYWKNKVWKEALTEEGLRGKILLSGSYYNHELKLRILDRPTAHIGVEIMQTVHMLNEEQEPARYEAWGDMLFIPFGMGPHHQRDCFYRQLKYSCEVMQGIAESQQATEEWLTASLS